MSDLTIFPKIPQTPKNVPTMLTINETAASFNLPKHFVRRAVMEHKVVSVTSGKKYLVNAEKFAEWLAVGEQPHDSTERIETEAFGGIRCLS